MSKRREFFIKRNDTSPALLFQIDPPVNLTAATVVFNMLAPDGTVAINRAPATIPDLPNPTLRYDFTAMNTAMRGNFQGEFEVTYGDGTVETWPNDGHITVRIPDDIA